MENKHNPSNTENYNIEPIGPSTDELKEKFKEGSIPLEEDFYDLIDIADIGRKATGQEPGQTDNPNSALELDKSGLLMVKINPTGGLKKDKDGLAVKAGQGINVDINGVSVNIQEIASVLADLIIPKGTIVPFYRDDYDNPPSGWAWCDGNNGTPKLNDNPPTINDSIDSVYLISSDNYKHDKRYYFNSDKESNSNHVAVNLKFMRYIMKI
ncbi:hypothetical protein KS18_04395 [Photorhabdus luminescens]|nr:hypothetical protein KS18_04395 [Photorhabdus luminescens]